MLAHFVDVPSDESAVFVPKVGRPDSMLPVIETYDGPSTVLMPTLTVRWVQMVLAGKSNPLFEHNLLPVGIYASGSTLLLAIDIITLRFPQWVYRETESEQTPESESVESTG